MRIHRFVRALSKYCFDKEYRFLIDVNRGKYNSLDDETFIRRKYRAIFGHDINLDNPKTFNEKLNWMKLYDHNFQYVQMVDKFAAKKYVSELIGEEYIIPLLGGPWYDFESIDFDNLPDQFVLKTSHDCGGVVICKDKFQFNRDNAKHFLEKHMQNNYFLTCREWPYKYVKPCIFAEKYMSDDNDCDQLTDYKFFCFDGKVKAMFVATDRALKDVDTKFDFFDENFEHLPIIQGHPNASKKIDRPATFEKMKELASILSKGFPELRVDFYNVGDQIYFGELTLFHFGGLTPFKPEKWDGIFGDWIVLPNKNNDEM